MQPRVSFVVSLLMWSLFLIERLYFVEWYCGKVFVKNGHLFLNQEHNITQPMTCIHGSHNTFENKASRWQNPNANLALLKDFSISIMMILKCNLGYPLQWASLCGHSSWWNSYILLSGIVARCSSRMDTLFLNQEHNITQLMSLHSWVTQYIRE